ncbi:MAG: hypothetical protein M3N57_11760 [Actinomycetota bacterium]|nr:hypothetical protein [Actinomycetota bacterium]
MAGDQLGVELPDGRLDVNVRPNDHRPTDPEGVGVVPAPPHHPSWLGKLIVDTGDHLDQRVGDRPGDEQHRGRGEVTRPARSRRPHPAPAAHPD